MNLSRLLIAVGSTVFATAALAGDYQGPTPKLIDLINQNYMPNAVGKIVMKRKLLPLSDAGIFAYPTYPRDGASCVGGLIVTVEGSVDSCDVADAFVEQAGFARMRKDDVEFVCILYGSGECHRAH